MLMWKSPSWDRNDLQQKLKPKPTYFKEDYMHEDGKMAGKIQKAKSLRRLEND